METLLPLAGIVFLIALGVVLLYQQFQKSLYKQQLEKEAIKSQHQQALLATTIKVQEDERKRIAQDLHDELAATLSLSRMNLMKLESVLETSNPKASQELENVRSTVETALASTRRISHELMPVQLASLGLKTTLQQLAHRAREAGPIELELALPANIEAIAWPAKLTVYRVLSELLNNTLKHANATAVSIALQLSPNALTLHYTDNGNGLPANTTSSGLGLQSVEARARALNGSFTLQQPLQGFAATLTLPIHSPPHNLP